MTSDFVQEEEDAVRKRLADKVFGEIDDLVAGEREADREIERQQARRTVYRKQIERLKAIAAAEGLLRSGQAGSEGEMPENADDAPGMTHQEMIMSVVREHGDSGIRPFEIGNEIRQRYGKDITTSLHTQLSRLSKAGKIRRQGEGWKESQKNAG